jgi:predicted MFS family arabinose efflux permease
VPDAPPTASPVVRSEKAVIWLITAVQFVNVLDFVMVMPMGPDFAKALAIPESQLGLVGGAYTAAAGVAGLVGALFLDRFDRRKALGVAMLGLVVGTFAGGFATGLPTLLAARVLAGAFGGPATSLSFSIISDVIPSERRGKAMAAVMSAFSVASVLGVPMGLYLAESFGWRAPFLAVGSMGLFVALGAVLLLPPLRLHLQGKRAGPPTRTFELLGRPLVRLSYTLTASVMIAGFTIIPNISAYLQGNLGYPRPGLKWLYLAGGIASYLAVRLVGFLVDRYGSFRVGSFGASLALATIFVFFYSTVAVPPMLLFVVFMTAMSFRNVSHTTLTSKVPGPHERARFQSIQSAVQHAASAAGAFLSSQLLTTTPLLGPDGQALKDDHGKALVKLVGMPRVAVIAMAFTALLPLLFFLVERSVKRRDAVKKAEAAGPSEGAAPGPGKLAAS